MINIKISQFSQCLIGSNFYFQPIILADSWRSKVAQADKFPSYIRKNTPV